MRPFVLLFPLLFAFAALPIFGQDSLSSPVETLPEVVVESPADEISDEPASLPPRRPALVEARQTPAENWAKAASGLDYSRDVPEIPKSKPDRPRRELPNWNIDWAFWGQIFQILAIVLAALGLGWGIFRMLQEPSNRQLARDGTPITLENAADFLHESDLDKFLREALAAGDFGGAVRVYYLLTIKQLSQKNALAWSREKTNRDYLREMKNHPLSASFREATRTYERVWYGNQTLDEPAFQQLEPTFRRLLHAI